MCKQLRPHSYETFHVKPHSCYATLKRSCFVLLLITFLWLPCTLRETWSFARWLSFEVSQHFALPCPRWLTLGCKCTRTSNTAEARKLLIPRVWKGALHLWSVILSDQVKELYVLRSCSFPLRGAAIVSVTEKWMTRKEKVSFSVGWNNHRRKRVLHECLKWTGLNPTSIKWMWSQMNVVSNEWSQMNLWQMKRSQLSAHPYTTYLYLQYNLRLWPGACQARKTTSSLAWFTRNNRYYSANATNGAVSMKTL